MPSLIALDWNPDALEVVEADVSGGRVVVQKILQTPWPAAIDRETDAAGIGAWLREQLNAAGVVAREAIAVLPREDVVTRRLELPQAPDAELPDLVRFQAASRSATPLDQLVLDFVPLPPAAEETGRPALLATIELNDLIRLKKVSEAAGLELRSLQASPFAIAEVAVRAERQRGNDPNSTILVVFQSRTRVELSILQQLGLVLTHQTRIDPQDERSLRGTIAEINRSIVTLGQMLHRSVEVERVVLIHDGDVDPGLEQALSDRFGGKLQVVDPAADSGVDVADAALRPRLAAVAPAIGALLARGQASVPAVDFLSPRRPPPQKDIRRERLIKYGSAAAAAVALLAIGATIYSYSLDNEISRLQKQDGELTQTLKNAEGPLALHGKIAQWTGGALRPLSELDRLNEFLPGSSRMLLLNIHVQPPPRGEALARITGVGVAKQDRDINNFFDALASHGYRVQPQVPEPYKSDPDYPRKFTIDVSRLPPPEPPQKSP